MCKRKLKVLYSVWVYVNYNDNNIITMLLELLREGCGST